MKSRLHKLEGLTYDDLKQNIDNVIKETPKEKYENIIKGTYQRPTKFIRKKSNRTKKLFVAHVKVGVLNVQRCKKFFLYTYIKMSTITNNCLNNLNGQYNCISGSSESTNKCLDQTLKKVFIDSNRPCINIPFYEYYPTLLSIVNSNWDRFNVYLIKSGIGSQYKMGILGINHAAVILEVITGDIFSYHLVGEVEVGDKNIVVNSETAVGAIFPTFTSSEIQEPKWKGIAVILAGPICYKLNNNEKSMNPRERVGAVSSICGLTEGSGNPIPLLFLYDNNSKTCEKLSRFIHMINKIDVNNNYIFLGFKSFQPNTNNKKCVTGFPYTCETFASVMASFLYREFKNHIDNDKIISSYYQVFFNYKHKNNSCLKNLPSEDLLTTMYEGRYKNAQLFLHVEEAGFLNVKNNTIDKFNGKHWGDMSVDEQTDCFNFWYFLTNDFENILISIKEIVNTKNKLKKIEEIVKLIKYIESQNIQPFNNLWLKGYKNESYVFKNSVFFSAPIKTYNIISKKYVLSTEKILNIFLLTEGSIQKESDFESIINLKLIDQLFPIKNNLLPYIVVILILLILIILVSVSMFKKR